MQPAHTTPHRPGTFRSAKKPVMPYKDAIVTEYQRQRYRIRGWQSVDLMNKGQIDRADSASGSLFLLVAVLAGLVLGSLGVFVEATAKWVVNFRLGVCANFFWLGQETCCAYAGGEECAAFQRWGVFFGGEGGRHVGILNFFFFVLFACIFGCISSFLCKTFSPFAAGGGIIEVKTIVSGELLPRYLGGWTFVTKTLAVVLCTSCSLVVGKEGPFVHLGSCAADLVANRFGIREDSHRRELISAGAAGGVAVAFGAPVGGVIFAIEEIAGSYRYRSMMQALIMGTVAVVFHRAVNMWHTGKIVIFGISYSQRWHWFELPLFVFLGVFGGMLGSLWIRLNRRWCQLRKKYWSSWKVTEILVLVFISAVTHYFTPFLQSDMLELLSWLVDDCSGSTIELCKKSDLYVMVSLLIGSIIKFVLLCGTVGACVPSGTLVPGLAIGAMYGRAFGIWVDTLAQSGAFSFFGFFSACDGTSQCVIPAVYAIVGSATFLCGVTRMTICLAVIMFEMTGGLEYLVPIVFGIVAAKYSGEKLFLTESVYDYGIEDNKLPILEHHVTFDGDNLISEIYDSKPCIKLCQRETLRSLYHKIKLDKHRIPPTGYPVIVSEDRPLFVGYIERSAIEQAFAMDAFEAPRPNPASTSPERGTAASSFPAELPLHRHTTSTSAHLGQGVNDASRVIWFGRKRYSTSEEEGEMFPAIDLSNKVVRPPITVDPSESVTRAVAMFQALHTARVIVTEEGVFKGIVTRTDLLDFVRSKSKHH